MHWCVYVVLARLALVIILGTNGFSVNDTSYEEIQHAIEACDEAN